MSKIFSLLIGILLLASGCSHKTVVADYNVIPIPQNLRLSEGDGFKIRKSTKIVYPAGDELLQRNADFLADYIAFATGLELTVTDQEQANNVIVLSSDLPYDNAEAYVLEVDPEKVTISGASASGNFYGIQTLRKSIPADSDGANVLLPSVNISDAPRFGYRGMMLDIARHTFSLDFIKKYIDLMALHNINTFHWHLSDDQGWRIEIKGYPLLTEKGSTRKETLIGRYKEENPARYDGTPYGGYFTQEEAREIVRYAADRYITVIPEIDLPGHMLAAMTAYPELGCTGGPYEVGTTWGVFDDVLCLGNEKTFEMLEGIMTEICDIFPGEYIHIGGDECPRVRWEACPKCQARIRQLGLKDDAQHTAEDKLQSYCMTRMEKFLNSKGRRVIGWDEILEGGLAPEATVMSWRGIVGGIAAAKLHHQVIMVPGSHLYFDYPYNDDPSEPLTISGHTIPLEKVYAFEPLPAELTPEQKSYIIGVQANMWTEYMTSGDLVEYMVLPRMDALSEIQWSQPEKKDYQAFLQRLTNMRTYYDKAGYNYAKHVFEN